MSQASLQQNNWNTLKKCLQNRFDRLSYRLYGEKENVMSKLIKVRQVIKLSGWVNGSGWSYKNNIYDDQIIDIDSDDLYNMDWDWWEADEDNHPSEDSDTEIVVELYAEDADASEDKPLATHKAWASEIWKDRHNNISAAAAALGRKGGKSKSEAKAAASRENGKLGGRPRKQPGN
jgi:hypothetical protein